MPEDAKQKDDAIDSSNSSDAPQDESQSADQVLGSTQAQAIVEETPPPAQQDIPPAVVSAQKKHSRRTLVIILSVILALLGGAAAYWFGIRDSSPAQQSSSTTKTKEVMRLGVAVGLAEGTIEYSTDRSVTWQKLGSDVDLKEGDYVRTLSDGRLVLLVDDGSAVRLGANSTVALKSLETTDVVITNVAGEVYSRVTASSSRRYTVGVDDSEYTAKRYGISHHKHEYQEGCGGIS